MSTIFFYFFRFWAVYGTTDCFAHPQNDIPICALGWQTQLSICLTTPILTPANAMSTPDGNSQSLLR